MDIQKTVREIGFFETASNLEKVKKSMDIIQKVGASMPLPDRDMTETVENIAKWLCDFRKSKYMFFTPEIALIEEMAKHIDANAEIIIVIPSDLEQDAKDRVKNNLPGNITVTVLEEPNFPDLFFPGNGMIVICGYSGGNRAMVFPDTYRMAEHYGGFLGKIAFVPYMELKSAHRYDGWVELGQQRINVKWRNE